MNILLLNGSPHAKGNTVAAVAAVKKGFEANMAGAEVTVINVAELSIAPCKGCNACRANGGVCVQKDDAKTVLDAVIKADAVVFASPVYFFGITAQLKAAIDRLYAGGPALAGAKKIAVLAIGASPTNLPQYKAISDQFTCLAGFTKWNLVASKFFQAAAPTDLAGNAAALQECEALWKAF